MKIAVFGANGPTGRQVVSQALDAGHEVTAFVRDPVAFGISRQRLRVVAGDTMRDGACISDAVAGQDAVVSALGRGKRLRAEGLMRASLGSIISAMERHGVRRLIVVSAFGVGESRRDAPLLARIMHRLLLADLFADKEAAEEDLRRSGLDWTIVRPVMLTDGPLTARYRAAERLQLAGIPRISRADVAHFVVSQLGSADYLHKAAVLSA